MRRGHTSDRVSVRLWPYVLWPGVGLVAASFVLTGLASFVDWRWSSLAAMSGFAGAIAVTVGAVIGGHRVEVSRKRRVAKPKDWKALRRDAQRQAYIEALEDELGIDMGDR